MASAVQTDQHHNASTTVERFTLSRTNSGEQHPELMTGSSSSVGRSLFADAAENQHSANLENQALKDALAAATQKLAQMEEDSQCFLDEKVFDLVNTMCMAGHRSNSHGGGGGGGTGNNSHGGLALRAGAGAGAGAGAEAEEADEEGLNVEEALRLENTQLRLELLDQQQATKDRVQELEAQFESFCKKVLTMTAGGGAGGVGELFPSVSPPSSSPTGSNSGQAAAGVPAEAAAAATAAPPAAAAAAAASPRSRCSLAPSEEGMVSAVSASASASIAGSPESRRGRGSSASAAAGTPQAAEDEFQDAEEGVGGAGRGGNTAMALRTLLEEARKRSQALEEMSERRERIIIDLDLQTRTLEKRLRAAESRADALEQENGALRQCLRLGKGEEAAGFVPAAALKQQSQQQQSQQQQQQSQQKQQQTELAPPPTSVSASACGSVVGSPRERVSESPVAGSPVPCSSFGSEEEEDEGEGEDDEEMDGSPAMMRKRSSLIDELEECW